MYRFRNTTGSCVETVESELGVGGQVQRLENDLGGYCWHPVKVAVGMKMMGWPGEAESGVESL